MHSYAGFYHELFNEVGAGRVFDDVRAWLDRLRPAERRRDAR